MTLYSGSIYSEGSVRIGEPDVPALRQIVPSEDVAEELHGGLAWAQNDKDVHYFSVYDGGEIVGQIYLHDIGQQSAEAMIGYHLFQPHYRSKGIGTKALRLLQAYVLQETNLKRLIIITGTANEASRGIATKCKFRLIGGAREDPANLVVYEWLTDR
ncbi:MAG: GNAT family N-acetyltransferase [Caldilineaceae bacterium]